jgi:hypothetical protein
VKNLKSDPGTAIVATHVTFSVCFRTLNFAQLSRSKVDQKFTNSGNSALKNRKKNLDKRSGLYSLLWLPVFDKLIFFSLPIHNKVGRLRQGLQ